MPKRVSLKTELLSNFRPYQDNDHEEDTNFERSLAAATVVSQVYVIYDVSHFMSVTAQVNTALYHRHGDEGPRFNPRQKQAISMAHYLRQRGEIAVAAKTEADQRVFTPLGREQKEDYINALLLISDVEQRAEDVPVEEFAVLSTHDDDEAQEIVSEISRSADVGEIDFNPNKAAGDDLTE